MSVLLFAGGFSTFAQKTMIISMPMMAGHSALNADLTISLEFSNEAALLYIEETQMFEDWMLDREDWIKESISYVQFAINDTDTEAELQLEDWMLVDLSQEITDTWDFLRVDKEAPIKLEDWMICKEPWCKKKASDSISIL